MPLSICRKWFVNRGVEIRELASAVTSPTESTNALAPQFAAKFSKRIVEEIEKRHARGALMFHLPYNVQIELLKRTYTTKMVRTKFIEELAIEFNLPLQLVSNWMASRARKNRGCDMSNLTAFKQDVLQEEMEKSLDLDVDRLLILAYVLHIPIAYVQKSFNDKRAELGFSRVDVMIELETQKMESNVDEHVVVKPKLEEKKKETSNVLTSSLARPTSSSHKPKKGPFSPQIITTLFREFKRSKELTMERANQIASKIGLDSLKVQNWFTRLKVKLGSTSLSQLESLLYENLRPDQVLKLENTFHEKKAISMDEARILSVQLGILMRSILNWFTQRRCYDILKSSEANDVLETSATNEQVDEFEELHTEENTSNSSMYERYEVRLFSLDEIPSSMRIRLLREEIHGIAAERIPQLAVELNVSQDFIKRFIAFHRGNMREQTAVFRKTEDLLLMEEQFATKDWIDQKEAIALSRQMSGRVSVEQIFHWFTNTRALRSTFEELTEASHTYCSDVPESAAPVVKSSSYKTFLFEEFKRSSSMDPIRRNRLATYLGITSSQVFFHFRSLMQSLKKPTGTIVRSLMSMSHSQLVTLAAEYHKSRFIAGIKRQKLSRQLGVSKLAIIRWFRNARCYELKTGEKFKPNDAATLRQKKFGLKNNKRNVVKKPTWSCTEKSSGLDYKHEQILRTELMQNDELTQPRLLSLSQRLNLHSKVVEEWFAENASLASRARVLDRNKRAAKESAIASMATASKFYRKLPLQKDMLFEEFKRTPSLANERMTRLARQMDLSKNQVYSWFYDMRRKVAASSDISLAPEYRNCNLNATQIARLEEEFAKHPYIRDEIREQLELELTLSPRQIRSWFKSRRLYDIRTHWMRNNCGQYLEKCLEKKKSNGGGDSDNNEWSFKPIITAIESKQQKVIEMTEHKFDELLPVKIEKFPESVSMVDIKEEPCNIDTEITEWDFKSEPVEHNEVGVGDADEKLTEKNSLLVLKNEPLDTTIEERLERIFEKESFPTSDEICNLAEELHVSQERVSCWFRSRRAKSIFTIEETGIEIIPENILQVDLTTDKES